MALSSPIAIYRGGQYAAIMPPVAALSQQLVALSHAGVDDPRHGVTIVPQPLPLAWPSEWRGTPITEAFAGMEPKIKAALEEAGYEVELKGNRPGCLPAPRRPKSGDPWPDEAVLNFVRRHERGLIRYDPAHVQVERFIAEVAKAYPKKRILIVATRQNDVLHLCRQLEERGFRVGKAFYGGEPSEQYRIAVTTYSCVGSGLADARNRDIVFYLNPAEAFCRSGRWSLAALGRARLYGFVPMTMELPSPVADLVARSLARNR